MTSNRSKPSACAVRHSRDSGKGNATGRHPAGPSTPSDAAHPHLDPERGVADQGVECKGVDGAAELVLIAPNGAAGLAAAADARPVGVFDRAPLWARGRVEALHRYAASQLVSAGVTGKGRGGERLEAPRVAMHMGRSRAGRAECQRTLLLHAHAQCRQGDSCCVAAGCGTRPLTHGLAGGEGAALTKGGDRRGGGGALRLGGGSVFLAAAAASCSRKREGSDGSAEACVGMHAAVPV